MNADAVVIMDADGEDRPKDIPVLIAQHNVQPAHLIVASRTRRSEGFIFRVGYSLYKNLFRLLSGKNISFGNFSLIPMFLVKKLVYVPSIWNHFAATALNSCFPLSLVPCARGSRYAGEPKTNLVNLVVHGLSAIAVFSDVMLTRMLLFLAFTTSAGVVASLIVVVMRLFTNVAAPGWATSAIGIIAIVCLQSLLLVMMAAFIVLSNRATIVLPPIQHAKHFIDHVVMLFPRNATREATETFALPRWQKNLRDGE